MHVGHCRQDEQDEQGDCNGGCHRPIPRGGEFIDDHAPNHWVRGIADKARNHKLAGCGNKDKQAAGDDARDGERQRDIEKDAPGTRPEIHRGFIQGEVEPGEIGVK